MARAVVPLNFNAFLEKAKLKDDGSNYTEWVRNLRIILIVAQKNYVLEAPLRKFIVPRHHMMIGCDKLYAHIQRVQASFAHTEYSG